MEVSGRRPTKTDGHSPCLLCDPCKGENEDEPAVAYCTVCNEYLCHGCRKAHTRANVSKGHALMEGGKMPTRKPTSDKGSMCSKHSDKSLDYYCKSDDQFCCSVCADIDHKQCIVQYIDDIAIDFHKSNEYVALEKATVDLIRLLQKTKGTAARNMNGIATIHANFISDLQQFRSEINNILDSLENAAKKEAQTARDSDHKTVSSIATACDSMLSDIQSLTSELEVLNRCKQNTQLVICSKRALKTVNTYSNRVKEITNQNRIRDYTFQPNETIRHFLNSLGDLGNMKEGRHDEQTQHDSSTNTGADSYPQRFSQPAARYVGNIEVGHSTDTKSCGITGGVIIDETKLALVDYCNSSVKIADLNSITITSCIELPTRPCDITCVNQGQIVVTCYCSNKGKLVFLKVGKSLSFIKELNIGKQCRGIAYTNDTFFVTFIKPESSVKAIDMNGNVLKTYKAYKNGGALFSDPWYISLSTDQQNVFVSDWSNHTVTSLTLGGTVQHVYTEDNLKSPRGMAVDRNGTVQIAGYLSHTIHQLSTKSNRSQIILDQKDGLKYPSMVTYCKIRHRLYISVQKGNRDEVRVYQLQ